MGKVGPFAALIDFSPFATGCKANAVLVALGATKFLVREARLLQLRRDTGLACQWLSEEGQLVRGASDPEFERVCSIETLPQRHKKRRRLYHKDSSIIRLRPTHPNHVWAIDFVHDKLDNGRGYKMLTVLDEYTRQALAVTVRTRMRADDVLEALYPLLLRHGTPEYIRSDNGPEFIAQAMQDWLARVGIKPIRIYPGSPWENGYNERFNGTLRREVLNAEWFTTTKQAQIVINQWLRQYNHIRPHQALNMRPPVPETLIRNGTELGG